MVTWSSFVDRFLFAFQGGPDGPGDEAQKDVSDKGAKQ